MVPLVNPKPSAKSISKKKRDVTRAEIREQRKIKKRASRIKLRDLAENTQAKTRKTSLIAETFIQAPLDKNIAPNLNMVPGEIVEVTYPGKVSTFHL